MKPTPEAFRLANDGTDFYLNCRNMIPPKRHSLLPYNTELRLKQRGASTRGETLYGGAFRVEQQSMMCTKQRNNRQGRLSDAVPGCNSGQGNLQLNAHKG
jgi:hypothetical protein